jgi:thiamine-phosphate pyrophosphorylase
MNLAEQVRLLNFGAGRHRGLPRLFLLTDTLRLSDPLGAASRLPTGAAVLLRHYDAPDRPTLARALARLCRARNLALLIAEDTRLAADIGADGVHFRESSHARIAAARARHPGWTITAAAHSFPAMLRAGRHGADAAILSPVFATRSHPGAHPIGPVRFADMVHAARKAVPALAVYALGGITAANVGRLKASGAAGVAAIASLAER